MADARPIDVLVVLAEPEQQRTVRLILEEGATVSDAVARSGLLEGRAGPGAEQVAFGIYGRQVAPGRVLEPGDRVEILRPLAQDPRLRRRRLAREGRSLGRGPRR